MSKSNTTVKQLKIGSMNVFEISTKLNSGRLVSRVNMTDRELLAIKDYFTPKDKSGESYEFAAGLLMANLSKRETDVVKLLNVGHNTISIAEILSISPRTVEVHLYQVRKKLGVKNVVQLLNKLNLRQ